MKYPKLYAWTTESYSKNGWLKVGETIQQTVDERISQTDTTGMAEKPIKVWEYDATKLSKQLGIFKNLDKYLHNILSKKGFNRLRDNREFFEIDIKDVISTVNELERGSYRPNSYAPRDEQWDGINQALTAFNSGVDTFLWNAKMRFGKTFATYKLAKEMNAKRILILTHKVTVEDSWCEELNSHVDFDGWQYVYVRDDLKHSSDKIKNLKKTKPAVIFGSFQDATGNDLTTGDLKRKWRDILNINFDLIVIDEAHYGYSTKRSLDFVNMLSFKNRLLLSGTPIKLLMSGEFDEDNSFSYSYIDEQVKRNAEKKAGWKTDIYRWLPVMNIFTYEIGKRVLQDVEYYDEDEGLTLSKFFGSDDGEKMKNSAAVNRWLDLLSSEDERIYASPFNNDECSSKLNHMFWILPGVKSVKAMKNALESHYYFKRYKVVVAADDNDGEGDDTLKIVRNAIKKNSQTITLSCGKLTTGISIKEWNSVFMLSDGESPETYWQTVFRCQTPNKEDKKEDCFVFDFNPNRVFNMLYEYAEKLTRNKKSTSQVIRELLDVIKVHVYEDNRLKKLSQDEFQKIIKESINPDTSIAKFISKTMVDLSIELDDKASEIINEITGKGNVKLSSELSNSELNKGKNFSKNKNKRGKNVKRKKTQEKLIIEKLTYVTKMIPTYIFVSSSKIENVDDLISSDGDFEDIISITKSQFQYLIDNGYLRENLLNKAIESFNLVCNVS